MSWDFVVCSDPMFTGWYWCEDGVVIKRFDLGALWFWAWGSSV
jgi:hypothetical protein